jgi:hypothetical protein
MDFRDDSSQYSDSDASSLSDSDLSSWSDDESGQPATAQQALAGLFAPPPVLPGTPPRNNMLLRKQETSYANRSVNENTTVLAFNPTNSCYADASEPFGHPEELDRETVGYLVDANGVPYAQVKESKPPPPNTNRLGQTHAKSLRRALGYDPHDTTRKKTEVAGVTNSSDLMNGDADLAAPRRSAKLAMAKRGDAYHNQTHTQEFTAIDAGRQTYSGYNVSPAVLRHQAKRAVVEHTWRHELDREHEPTRAGSHAPAHTTHVAAQTKRKEVSDPFRREGLGDHSSTHVDATLSKPLVVHKSRREGDADDYVPSPHVATEQQRTSAAFGRAQPLPELEPQSVVPQSHFEARRAASTGVDVPVGEREIEAIFAAAQQTLSVRRVEASGAERAGTDTVRVERDAAATGFESFGHIRHADSAACTREDDVDAGAPDRAAQAGVSARVHSIDAAHDAAPTNRAATDGVLGPVRAGNGGTEAGYVSIGEDRVPETAAATWYFPNAASRSAGDKQRAARDSTMVHSGSQFLTDRLAQPNSPVREKYEYRMHPTTTESVPSDRSTAIPHGLRSEPPVRQQHASSGLHLMHSTGRSTPNTFAPQPSPMALR